MYFSNYSFLGAVEILTVCLFRPLNPKNLRKSLSVAGLALLF